MGTTLQDGGERFQHGWDVPRADLKPRPEFFDQGGFAQVNYPGLRD